jgi:hypothetical protein
MTKPEKLTLVLEQPLREELAQWAIEEGRPISNLLRRVVHQALEQRRQQQGELAA